MVFFNQGDTADEGRLGIPAVTLGNGNTSDIPAVSATYARGVEWAGTTGLQMRLFANVDRRIATTENVIAETPGGDLGQRR